ncbi:MAG TPA: CPBP family intramembrane glutamic endopeptidase [Acidimicrobiia bacterium]
MVADLAGTSTGSRVTFVWKWLRWTRWPLSPAIVAVAALTVTFDVVTAWRHINLGYVGVVPISPTLPIELVLVVMVGWRRLGLDRTNLAAWHEFLAVGSAALLFGVIQYARHIDGLGEALGLVLAALDEEIVYRLAVLILVGATVAKLSGRNWRNAEDWGVGPGLAAIIASGLVFSILPGHVAQISDTLHALPFVALGMVLGYAMLRTGALLPAVVVHALLNLATIATFKGEIPAALRSTLAASLLLALVLGTVVAGRRLGIFRLVPVVEQVPAEA